MAGYVLVLEIAAEGSGFELDAELDEHGRARAFFAWTGGGHGFEEIHEEPEPRVSHGPLTWPDVLDTWLRPHNWLEQYPRSIHPCIAELVRKELPAASADARARWDAALPALASGKPAAVGEAFRASILRAYDCRPHCIHPFIGDEFGAPGSTNLRVMTVGINAYVSEDDWGKQHPDWFAGWFREGRHKFDRRVAADASVLATALTAGSKYFNGLTYPGRQNVFHTNAVKVFMRESEGKRSNQLSREDFQEHLPTWHAELDVMAEHGVLPHVVVVFGRPFWEGAWQAFHPDKRPAYQHLTVHGFANAQGDGRHHANLIEVEGAAGRHKVALLCVRHPAARAAKKGAPEWLLALDEMHELLGFAPR